jgi:hypothetical protein
MITINTLKHAGTMFSRRRDALNALLLDCIMSASFRADDFPIDVAPFPFLCELIDVNGGEAAFQGLTTDRTMNSQTWTERPNLSLARHA